MRELEISDIWLASFILTILQIEPKLKPNPTNGMVSFLFPYSEDVLRAVTDFQGNKSVPAYSYSVNFKVLKNKMMRLKRSLEAKGIENYE
jgi:hypothetical protein